MRAIQLLTVALCNSAAIASPTVVDAGHGVTYKGLNRNGIEIFLNIPYAEDTGGMNRFKPPIPHIPSPGTTIPGHSYGPACPQALGPWFLPISLSNVTEVSEDCLNLNVARPKGVCAEAKLPVMVWIHGGSFWTGQNGEITTAPDGMILESVKNGLPMIHVAMNYRLGCKFPSFLYSEEDNLTQIQVFVFAQSDALEAEGSENAGLRDQRLAIEWVRDNIEHFGGDPEKITIFGQSSGGMCCGLHDQCQLLKNSRPRLWYANNGIWCYQTCPFSAGNM